MSSQKLACRFSQCCLVTLIPAPLFHMAVFDRSATGTLQPCELKQAQGGKRNYMSLCLLATLLGGP